MSVRSLNWLKFGGLVALAFALGLLFAGLLVAQRSGKELRASIAQSIQGAPEALNQLPGRVNSAIHRATDKINATPIDGKGL